MKIDLNEVPFSRRNSYMVISELNQKYSVSKVDAGLYLRTVRGSAERSMIAKLTPTFNGVPAPYETELEFSSLVLTSGSFRIEICYEDENTLLFRGGPGTGMKIDFLTEEYKNDYIYDIVQRSYTLYMANCYKNNCRYLIWALRDKISLDQKWNDNVAEYSRLEVKSSGAGFVFALQEVETEWDGKIRKFDFGLCRNETHTDFLQFLENMPPYELKYRTTVFKAAYLEWSSMIAKDKFLPRDAMLVSKNWLTDKTGWNLNFNALALSFKDPKRAWNQFALMFDMMDKSGRIPDSINDSYVKWNHVKPPMQGWFLSKMMEHMELNQEQLTEAYLVLQRSTKWWLRFRNFRGEGLCCYDHAKDSGWDNASVFSVFPPVTTPELQAFLILQMDVIAEISNRLGIEGDAKYWKQQSDKLLSNLLEKCFKNNLPVSIHSNTGEIIENGSILPYLVMLLGDRLPEQIRKACVAEVKMHFVTPKGIATERPDSPYYEASRKFRGPIWAPATYLILEALKACGEVEYAKEQAKVFLDMVEEKGLAENYDALTGEPTGPSIYTWTASAYLLIMNL